jgi:hypothetical protein
MSKLLARSCALVKDHVSFLSIAGEHGGAPLVRGRPVLQFLPKNPDHFISRSGIVESVVPAADDQF